MSKLTSEFADRVCKGEEANIKDLAFALQAVALCLHLLQADDAPLSGEAVDRWYDQTIGNNIRVMWTKVKPVAVKLKDLGILD